MPSPLSRPYLLFLLLFSNYILVSAEVYQQLKLHLLPAPNMSILAPQEGIEIIGDATHLIVKVHTHVTANNVVHIPCYVTTCSSVSSCLTPSLSQQYDSHFSEVLEFLAVPSALVCKVEIFLVSVENEDTTTHLSARDVVRQLRSDPAYMASELVSILKQARVSGQIETRSMVVLQTSHCRSIQPPSEYVQPRLFYMFSFNKEYRLLQLLLQELPPDVVDSFVLIEANMTHSGRKKPLHFQNLNSSSMFRKFNNKGRIVHIPVLDMTVEMSDSEREKYQRDEGVKHALKVLKARPDDMVVVTDVDGLVRSEILRTIKSCSHIIHQPFAFWLRHHVYNLKWQVDANNGMWGASEGPRLVRADFLMRKGGVGATDLFRSPKMAASEISYNIIFDAGWHLSWFGHDADSIVEKMRDSMDQELNILTHAGEMGLTFKDVIEIIQRMIERGGTLWGDSLVRAQRLDIPNSIQTAMVIDAALDNAMDVATGTPHQEKNADLQYWFGQRKCSGDVTGLDDHRNTSFVQEQDELWIKTLLSAGRTGTYCYVFGQHEGGVCDSSKRSINIRYTCKSQDEFDASIDLSCATYGLTITTCSNLRATLRESCDAVTKDTEGSMELQREVFLDDKLEIHVEVDGHHYIFRFSIDLVAEQAKEFCSQAGMSDMDCATLISSALNIQL